MSGPRRPRPPLPPLTARQAERVEAYVPLARTIAKRYWSRWIHLRDDIIAEAYWGLVQASIRYTGQVRFRTFARHRIRGAILDFLYPEGKTRWRPGTADMLTFAHVPQVWGDEQDRIGIEFVVRMSRRLPAAHGRFLRLMYLAGLNKKETARLMGLSESRGHYLHAEAMAYLKSDLEKHRERLIG
jgi:RNA polymerase sigma factor (sigma-70 family)